MIAKKRNRKTARNCISRMLCICVFAMTLTGCSGQKGKAAAPELMKPKAVNEAFRPVGYADIGNLELHEGLVVPYEEPYFWETSVKVDELCVELGQFVNEGDVIAKADVKEMKEAKEKIIQEKEYFILSHMEDDTIFEWKMNELFYKKNGFEQMGDIPGSDQTELEMNIEKENRRYDEMLYEYKLKQFDRRIAEQEKYINKAVICAKSSGYITYVKDLSESDVVMPEEILVVLADYTNTFVQLKYDTMQEDICKRFKNYFTYLDGERVELEEYEYPAHEILAADRKGMFPKIRMRLKDEGKMPEIGTTVPVFMVNDFYPNVLCIQRDSFYEDSEGPYVYVKTEEGKEIRHITIGKKDDLRVQVLSGLKEGEEVFYASEAVAPTKYTEYTVEIGEYRDIKTTDAIEKVMSKKTILHSKYEGKLVEIVKRDNDEVKKGDVICKIKINEGSAYLADLRNQIDKNKVNNDKQMKAFDEHIATLSESRGMPVTQTVEVETPDGKKEPVTQYVTRPFIADEISCQMEAEKCRKAQTNNAYLQREKDLKELYKKMSENNDGKGVISICADRDGLVKDMKHVIGANIKVGDEICKMEETISPYVQAYFTSEIFIGQSVNFLDEGIEEVFTGKVVGLGGRATAGMVYITASEDSVYVTGRSDAESAIIAYILPDQEEYYTKQSLKEKKEIQYSTKTIEGAYLLPAGVVQDEKILTAEKNAYYVWKIDGDRMIKQYVNYLYSAVNEEGIRVDCVVSGLEVGEKLAVTENKSLESANMDA